MKIKHFSLALALGLLMPFMGAQAAKVQNVKVEADFETLNLLWDRLSAEDYSDSDGYAIQWSDRQSDVQITKSITLYQENNQDDISLRRNSFDNNTYYFARVYTYKIDSNNNKALGNGSDMYKFKIDFNNTVTGEYIAITDPVISSDTGVEQDTSHFEFGALRRYAYDTFADFFWSQPTKMTSSDFDGFMITLSKNSDLTDPVVEATVDTDTSSVRITGLEADTNYYAQGSFYKNQGGDKVTFGESSIRTLKTIIAIPRDSSTRESRNIIKVENRAIRKISADGTASNSSSTSSSTSSSSSNSSTSTSSNTSSTNTTRSTQPSISNASQAQVRARISELQREISSLQSELRRWENQLERGNSPSTSTQTTNSTRSTISTSGLNVRERLKLILEAKRNQR